MTKCVSKWFLPFSYPFFFFNLANEWMSVICPHRKGKRCWLSEYKLDTPMSSLAKDELSVSMVTRSSLSYGYPLTSLWSYFLLYSRPYRHTRASARRRHTLPNTHRFSFHPPCPCCFFYHILSSPTLLHSPWLFLRLKTIPCPLSTRIAFYMSPAPLFLSFFDSHAAHYINRAQAFCCTPPDSVSIDLPASWLWLHACEVVVLFLLFFLFLGVFFESQGSWDPPSQVLEKCLS